MARLNYFPNYQKLLKRAKYDQKVGMRLLRLLHYSGAYACSSVEQM